MRVHDLGGIDLDEVRPARKFVGAETNRNKPTRPMLERLGLQCDVESDTESIEAHLLDRDPQVVRLVPQPFWLKRRCSAIRKGREVESWTWVCPDFLVERIDGSLEIVEVKHFGINLEPAAVRKFVAVREACQTAGMEFSLREGLSSAERAFFGLLSIYRRTRFLPLVDVRPFRDAALAMSEHGATLSALWTLDDCRIAKPMIWWMIWHYDLCIDWTEQVGAETVVRRHGPECADLSNFPVTGEGELRPCGPHPREMIGPDADRRARAHARRLHIASTKERAGV